MRIGILFHINQPIWSSGVNQTAFLLAELFITLQHQVVFVHEPAELSYYHTAPFNCTISELSCVSKLDWLIDIDGHLDENIRMAAAHHTIIFLRTFLQFSEMDSCIYVDYPYRPRSMKGVYEIWCWDILNPQLSLESIQTLFPCPIRRVPFIWSPNAFQTEWKNVTCTYQKEEPWTIHVAEKNTNTSSAILPLCAIRELTLTHKVSAQFRVHNTESIQSNRFFQENIINNLEAESLPISYEPAEPWHTWNHQSLVLSHSRFVPIRPSLLQLLWLGVPVVHNSPVLAKLHPMLRKMFYTGNNIEELCKTVTTFLADPSAWYEAHHDIKFNIHLMYGIESLTVAWKNIMDSLPARLTAEAVSFDEIPYACNITIAFSNMWEGFNYHSNFIMDALRHYAPTSMITGIPYSADKAASLIICGPHGSCVALPNHIPKVYYSAENWDEPQGNYSLYLTNSLKEDDTHLRIPTWMMFIDWFGNTTNVPRDCTDNPIRFPLAMAMQPHPIPFQDRKDFCAFVVSNPTCSMRNEAFHYLNAYKPVHSGGGLYNNIGGQLALKYPGGGCGDVSKYDFFSTHQFTLSFENSQASGYITEKVLHAKMAGCVPLYWGDANTDIDFVPHSFINLSAISSAEAVVDVIKKLESRPDICAAIAAKPILDETKKQAALQKIEKMSQLLLKLATKTPPSLARIERTFIVNLDSRPDRWDSLMKAEPTLEHMVTRVSAVHGKSLTMTRAIYKRYKNNPFGWKKGVLGCYMSHINIWKQIAKGSADKESGDLFLILEDDVRFVCGWMEQWNRAVSSIPADAELLYWGGVLPPNKVGLSMALESVNDDWASIKPNTLFTKDPFPFFHFCTYSYVISKAGAQKLLDYLAILNGMPYSGVDHLLGHAPLKTYVAQPLLSKCVQEEDPAYLNSQFNDLHREDKFDSDIWNNNDCFTIDELSPFFDESVMTLYYLQTEPKTFELYERTWLQDMFQRRIECKPFTTMDDAEEDAWFFVQRPHSEFWKDVFMNSNRPFNVLHLSDEFKSDCISFYTHPLCKAVIRNYTRADVPDLPHILTIPLGYHYRHNGPVQPVWKRKWLWSFHGTDWFDRSTQLAAFQSYVPHSCRLQPEWNHPTGTKEEEYMHILENSMFCPILKGNNVETFRLYEALEAGVLPLFGPTISPEFMAQVQQYIDLSNVYDWTNVESMNIQAELKEIAQLIVISGWTQWKMNIQAACRKLIKNSV
jgi:GR25 family glycosyltransferase involved in LPS biosynthesis